MILGFTEIIIALGRFVFGVLTVLGRAVIFIITTLSHIFRPPF